MDALPVLAETLPDVCDAILAEHDTTLTTPCLQEGNDLVRLLTDENFTAIASWQAAAAGLQAPQFAEDPMDMSFDAGEFRHGWQFWASSTREHHYCEHSILPFACPPRLAMLRSQSGPHASDWMLAIPRTPSTSLNPVRMQIALRRRLRWP